ncbi:DUF6879 family protein [Kitasatospora sp. NPDC005748]|uniref:DUF6879 family protein n=1 Tax=Kitasatospora sp. NPDC005748 TaxID=3157063 RepID=UPI0033FD7945
MGALIGFDEFDGMFESLQHSAFRLETRRRYRSDEQTETYRRFAAGQAPGWDLDDPTPGAVRAANRRPWASVSSE